jgi:hypothetical protein
MKILLNKLTKDSDLKTGLQVCYQNIDGVFNNLGIVTDIITDKDGIKNYLINTAMGAYMADELKLIAPEPVDNFDELKKEVNDKKSFVPVTERLYYYALEVLPPIYLKNKTFQMGECYSGSLYWTFGQKDGQYLGCLCDKLYSIQNF